MAEAQTIETDSKSHLRNMSRVQRDEEELNKLLEEAGISNGEVQQETPEEATEEESSSAEPVKQPVQAEGDTKQKEEPKSEAQEEDLSAEEKTFKQRYSDIRRHMDDKQKEFSAKIEKLEAQLDAATKNELVLPKSTEEVDAWAKKYPDVAGIIETIADKKANERATDLETRMQELEELRVTARREKAEAELAGMHPDFVDIREDDAFHTWARDQPKWVQDALYENAEDAKSVSRVIDLYKADKGITTKKKTNTDKSAAASVKTKGKATPEADESSKYIRESQVAKMSIKEYEKRMDEIMEAQRKGNFIYDMSKK